MFIIITYGKKISLFFERIETMFDNFQAMYSLYIVDTMCNEYPEMLRSDIERNVEEMPCETVKLLAYIFAELDRIQAQKS